MITTPVGINKSKQTSKVCVFLTLRSPSIKFPPLITRRKILLSKCSFLKENYIIKIKSK